MKSSHLLRSLVCGAPDVDEAVSASAPARSAAAVPARGQHGRHAVSIATEPRPEPTGSRTLMRGARAALGNAKSKAKKVFTSRGSDGASSSAAPPSRGSEAVRGSTPPDAHAQHAQASGAGPSRTPEQLDADHEHLLKIKAGLDAARGIVHEKKSRGFLACFGKIASSSRRAGRATPNAAALAGSEEPHQSVRTPVREQTQADSSEISGGSRRTTLGEFLNGPLHTSPDVSEHGPLHASPDVSQHVLPDVSPYAPPDFSLPVSLHVSPYATPPVSPQVSPWSSPPGTPRVSSDHPLLNTSPTESPRASLDGASEDAPSAVEEAVAELQELQTQLRAEEPPEAREESEQIAALIQGETPPTPLTPVAQQVEAVLQEAAQAVRPDPLIVAPPDDASAGHDLTDTFHDAVDTLYDASVEHDAAETFYDASAEQEVADTPHDAIADRARHPDHVALDVRPDHLALDVRPDHIAINIPATAEPVSVPHDPGRVMQTVASVGHFLRGITENKYENAAAGWGANIANAALREGSIVATSTALREVVGYLAERGLQYVDDHARGIASAGILAGVAGLNLAALVRETYNGTATKRSVTAHAFNLAAIGTAGMLSYGNSSLGGVLPLLIKGVFAYAAPRDVANLFVKLDSNREQLAPGATHSNMAANWADTIVYATNQYVTNTLQGTGASHSGTSSAGQAQSLRDLIPHVLAFAGANAAGETADGFSYPALTAFFDRGGLASRQSVGQGLAGVRDLRISASVAKPTMADAVNKLLGPFTARTTLFAVLYAVSGALGSIKPTKHLSEKGVNDVTNMVLSLLSGLLTVPYVASLDTQPAPAQHPEERDLEAALPRDADVLAQQRRLYV
ncbi:hypothetical protein FSO04_43690 [Paraburkholderia madseniana]|uniref:Uncharacterized protein n=1 Tax=Paraburkholderia madseniana TaxID=2599607 RepID=A0A6N6W1I3_9BURK|nr:hypothetical protein [Paraburkholderia madseniana]KAE8753698.1 hypothetical protein FSO04_43690 [Paraburkholderia madseniana]